MSTQKVAKKKKSSQYGKPRSIRFEQQTFNNLTEAAELEERSFNKIVNQACDEYIHRYYSDE